MYKRSSIHTGLAAIACPLLLIACGSSSQNSNDGYLDEVATADEPARDLQPELPADAYERGTADPDAPAPRTFKYRDGERTAEVYLDASMVAEFAPSNEGRTLMLASTGTATEAELRTAGVRMWNVDGKLDTLELAGDLDRGTTPSHFSPVFSPDGTAVGAKWALPGGVVVGAPRDWTTEQVADFARAQGLELEQRIGGEISSTFMLKTAAGLESLEIANRLAESGELRWASPNWWKSTSTR